MGKGKKPFIDRKSAVTFHLVHRSQHDPLVTDEAAPQRVLVEATPRQKDSNNKQTEGESLTPEKRKEEQKKYGIHFDDEYNYLQHLKKPEQEVAWEFVENPNHARKRLDEGKVTTAPKLQLPSSVFATEFEEDVGMLNKAAPHPGPRPDWDPDVVAALDDDFDFDNEENQLEDDFVLKAMEGGGSDDEDDMDGDDDDEEHDYDSDNLCDSEFKGSNDDEDDEEIMDRLAPLLRERNFKNEETKSRFTEYSMSSSVLPRSEQLNLLDDRFERFYASYDDQELGDLSMEDIEGTWGQKHPYVMNCFKEFKKAQQIEEYKKEWDAQRLEKYQTVVDGEEDPNEELVEYEVKDDKSKKWDCESILSTYSNIYNRPKVIEEQRKAPGKIKIDPKTGLPANVLRGGENSQLTAKALAKLEESSGAVGAAAKGGPKSLCDKSMLTTLSLLSIRPKDETPEEKKERKRLLKEYRNERRIERKANAEAFKMEKKRQVHVKLNQNMNQTGKQIV